MNRQILKWLIILLAAFVAVSCAAADEASPNTAPVNVDVGGDPLLTAEDRLFNHDLVAANRIYTERLLVDPDNGSIAVGKAVTDFLLIPYSPEFGAVLTDGLGATRPLNSDRDVLFREEGLLDLLSRGVDFQDDGVLSGIETILEGELPWERGSFESPQTFFANATSTVNVLLDRLVDVADSMEPIYETLDIALKDSSFGAFYMPGTVFFEEELSLELGKSEIAFMRAGVAGLRTGIYFAAAYDADWSLADAFGPRWEAISLDPEDPLHQPGFTYDDYVNGFLSDVLAREIRNAQRLSDSREAARDALLNVRAGLEFGIARVETNEPDRELEFGQADLDEARNAIDFIQAIENSLFGPTAVPFTEPDLTMDLSVFFEDGRTLPAETPWFERTVTTDEFGDFVTWETTDEAFETFFVRGVFTPEFTADNTPTVEIGSPTSETTLFDALAGELSRTVESTYGTR